MDLIARITEVMNLPDNSGKGLALTGKGYTLLHNIRTDVATERARYAELVAAAREILAAYEGIDIGRQMNAEDSLEAALAALGPQS